MKTLHYSMIVIACIVTASIMWYLTSYDYIVGNHGNNGTLSGSVIRSGGPVLESPEANYEVDVYAVDGITLVGKVFSDANAHYSIQLPAGNYTVYVPDYPDKQTHFVSVFPGKDTFFNIVYGRGYK